MGSVVKKRLDKTWSLVNFNTEKNGSVESQLLVDIPDSANFDDILSNTSSDESDCPTKPDTADSTSGEGSCDFTQASDYGHSTLVHADSDGGDNFEEIEDDDVISRGRIMVNHLLMRINNLSTLQIILLTSSATVMACYCFQRLWFLMEPRAGLSMDDSLTPSILGYNHDNTLVFNNVEIMVPFEKYGTKKFIVDFEKKVAYPVTDPEDFVPTQAGKFIVSKLLGYQLTLFYKLHYEWLPMLTYKYQVLSNHINEGISITNEKFESCVVPSCVRLANKARVVASDGVLKIKTIHIQRTCQAVGTSCDEIVNVLNNTLGGLQSILSPWVTEANQFIKYGYERMAYQIKVEWNIIGRWSSKKWFLVSRQAQKYINMLKHIIA
ncbi:uncharacterized protein Ecym_8381 [Eremothecium cymbalariae DBVPG|uniref:Uncharacterized protein n=1 Tax=Eremothecium cymbalariae (strain CBS 270.75 / DBVPG 7215 / KCTC 17166 / NRRL Y-17582) TaxID=931890 RepID=G8JXS7_ERECY|nr:Hypothetical protein Ecym_8381 [Eremothecium cymbalariae DBVPG\